MFGGSVSNMTALIVNVKLKNERHENLQTFMCVCIVVL